MTAWQVRRQSRHRVAVTSPCCCIQQQEAAQLLKAQQAGHKNTAGVAWQRPHLLTVIQHQGLRNVVDGQSQSCPPGNHNGENSCPNGQQGNDDEERGGDGANNVGPHTRAVHDTHEWREATNCQWAVLAGKYNLKVTLHNTAHHQHVTRYKRALAG